VRITHGLQRNSTCEKDRHVIASHPSFFFGDEVANTEETISLNVSLMIYVVSEYRVGKELDTGMNLLSKLSFTKRENTSADEGNIGCIQ